MSINETMVTELGFSVRASNALRRAEIHTLGELLEYTKETLLEIPNLGAKTADEILEKIEAYKDNQANTASDTLQQIEENFDEWIKEETSQQFVIDYLKGKKAKIEDLELLSPRSFNILMINQIEFLHQIMFWDEEKLLSIAMMDESSAKDILKQSTYYIRNHKKAFLEALSKETEAVPSLLEMVSMPEYHTVILQYVKLNDRNIAAFGISTTMKNRLLNKGCVYLSDLIFKTEDELKNDIPLNTASVSEIMNQIRQYLQEHELEIMALCRGDVSVLWSDARLEQMILNLYQEKAFGGFSLKEFQEKLNLPEQISMENLKRVIGKMIEKQKLEYVDFRCYRVYKKFEEYSKTCNAISERSRIMIEKRLHGFTLEEVAQEYGLTRERVRQIINADRKKIEDAYFITDGVSWFDEDYYRYFYETYSFEKKDGSDWFGISVSVYHYLDMIDVKQGKKDLQSALEDPNLDAGLKLKIKNYLNRNKLYIDGIWIEKKRPVLEEYVVRTRCREDTSFQEFSKKYNEFLIEQEVPYNEKIYFTDAVMESRKNRLMDSRFALWKYNEYIRYYDIDGQDYTELLDTLNLDAYENIEISTMKLFEDYPEIMEKYDIRDQYELHNLLRKIVPEGSYHNFKCLRMPEICFGTFDRKAALYELLLDNTPIAIDDFADLIHQEYGYDKGTISATYLQDLSEYYYQGVYRIEEKQMSAENMQILKSALTEDFYFIDEIRKIYSDLFPGADSEDVNPYNLKVMGFTVLSKYALQNYPSLDVYIEKILTEQDIIDLGPLRRRFGNVVSFSNKLMELKRDCKVIEFEPGQIINFRKLEASGITREMIQEYCDAVYNFAENNVCFSMKSLRMAGFESELFDFGFSDWFHGNILLTDSRFSYMKMYGTLIFRKGKEMVTAKLLLSEIVRAAVQIDTFDLINEVETVHDGQIEDRWDVIPKLHGTEIYYDDILDRFYANAEVYYRELDDVEN